MMAYGISRQQERAGGMKSLELYNGIGGCPLAGQAFICQRIRERTKIRDPVSYESLKKRSEFSEVSDLQRHPPLTAYDIASFLRPASSASANFLETIGA
jgi:hypothetical protein